MKKDSKQNIFLDILTLLNVKYNTGYSGKYFKQHPYKNTFYGLSIMLSEYGVNNGGIKIDNKKNDLQNIELPFVAQVGRHFVVVYKVTEDKVYYIWEGLYTIVKYNEFCNEWSGYALLIEKSPQSGEPNYIEHRKIKNIELFQKTLLKLSILFILFYILFSKSMLVDIYILLNILLNISGVYICYLILVKKMHLHNKYADKVCSLIKQQDCNDILESKASNILGVFGLGEIGLGYFLSNVIIMLFCSSLINNIIFVNILALPFTFWSLWYQKIKAKQWCILCLSVIVILWLMFIVNMFLGNIQNIYINIDIIVTGVIYLLSMLTSNIISNKVMLLKLKNEAEYELNNIKANEKVFRVFLEDSPYYAVNKTNSSVLFGNKNSQLLITILTNPHCEPCAKMHERIELVSRQ